MKNIRLTLLTLLISSSTIFSQDRITTKSISIFTDGNAYIEKNIQLKPINNKFVLYDDLVPRARFGTLSIVDSDNSIRSIKTLIDTVDVGKIVNSQRRKRASQYDMYEANLNKKVTINTKKETITGKLVDVLGDNNYLTHLLIKNSEKNSIIPVSDITSVSFSTDFEIPSGYEVDEINPYRNVEQDDSKLLLLLEFNNSSPKNVSMRYLQKGLRWNPYYIIELNENKNEANLQLKAEVLNDAEAFENTDLNLYVGNPNFEYSDYLADLVDYKNLMNPKYDKQHTINSREPVILGYSSISRNSFEEKEEDKSFHDFYVYKLKNESLKSRSRALYNLYQSNVNYEHVYVCSIGKNDDYRNYQNNNAERVFHCLKFDNDMGRLLGAGPATIIDNTNGYISPIAQSKIAYTPSNEECYIQLTQSYDVQVYQFIENANSSNELVKLNNTNYYKTLKTLKTKVANYKNEEVTLIIKQDILGQISENPLLRIIKSRDYLGLPNSKNTVEWRITLKPNEKKEVNYNYYFYSAY